MSHVKKLVLSLALLSTTVYGLRVSQAGPSRLSGAHGIACVMDVVVESRNQSNVVIGTEVYHKEFVLRQGESFSDDFSTTTRFKFLNASFEKNQGESTVAVDWFADVTVFNSVDFTTSVSLEDGAKRGKSTGTNSVFTSSGSTATTYSLVCVEN